MAISLLFLLDSKLLKELEEVPVELRRVGLSHGGPPSRGVVSAWPRLQCPGGRTLFWQVNHCCVHSGAMKGVCPGFCLAGGASAPGDVQTLSPSAWG